MTQLRVAVAEDNLLVAEGLCSLLAGRDGIEVCGLAAGLDELLALADAELPDVVLTDIRMPPDHSDEGVRAAVRLRETHPDMGVVVLSQFAEPDYALAVFDGGSRGRGYLLKERIDDVEHLVEAIRTVAGGGSFIDDEIVDLLVRARSRSIRSPLDDLSPRELEVLTEIATGKTNASIAEVLSVSTHAVEKHINSIFTKLGLTESDEVNRRVKAVLLQLAGRTDTGAN